MMEQQEEVTMGGRKVDNRTVVEVKGKHIVLSKLKSRIESSFNNSAIEEVHISAGISLSIDVNLSQDVWHGRNLIVMADEIKVCKTVTWDVSGKDSDHVFTSDAGISPDGLGKDGSDGYPGESGGNVLVMANVIEHPELLKIISNGGNGSNGQDGGDGKDGFDGKGISRKEFEDKFTNCARFFSSERHNLSKNIQSNMKASAKNVTHEWSKIGYDNGVYLVVDTHDGLNITYSLYYTAILYTEAFLLIKGSPGQRGKSGGEYGLGGQGGFPGVITVKSLEDGRAFGTETYNNSGLDGEDGEAGFDGAQGKNGWDMGFVDYQLHPPVFYGLDEKSKLTLSFHNSYSNKYRVYCPYKALDSSYAYAAIEESKLDHQCLETFKERNHTRARSDRQHHSKAVGKKSIPKVRILSDFYKYLKQVGEERVELERQQFEEQRANRLAQLRIEGDHLQTKIEEQSKKGNLLKLKKKVIEKNRLEQEANATRRQLLEQERLEKEEQRAERERIARERDRQKQLEISEKRQRLEQERIATKRVRLDQMRNAQERLRSEQERIAAERQQMEQETTARKAQVLQQIEIARERQQLALNQVQTASQTLAQLEIENELQRMAQQLREIQMQQLRQQIAQEEQQAEQQRIQQEYLQLQKKIEEEQQRLSRDQMKESEQLLIQQQNDEEEHRLALEQIDVQRQQFEEQQTEDQHKLFLQRQSEAQTHASAQQQIEEKENLLRQQQLVIEAQRSEQVNLQFIENDTSQQDIAHRISVLNRISDLNITRPINFAHDSGEQTRNCFTILEIAGESLNNEQVIFKVLMSSLNLEDWLQLQTCAVNFERLTHLLEKFEALKSKSCNEKEEECKMTIGIIEVTLKAKYIFVILHEISRELPLYHTETMRIELTANGATRYLEETGEKLDSIHPSVPSTLEHIIFENSTALRAYVSNLVPLNCTGNAITHAIKAFILQTEGSHREHDRVKHFYDEYHDYITKQQRNIDSITETFTAELQKSKDQEIFKLWNESINDDSLLENLEKRIKQKKSLSSLYEKLKCEEISEYDWEKCCADGQIINIFRNHLAQEGIMSKSCRVLVAYIYDVNIRVYTRNEDNQIVLLEDNNRESNTSIHVLLKAKKFILLKINESYRQLEVERMHKDKIYRQILSQVDQLPNINDIEDYLTQFSLQSIVEYNRNNFSDEIALDKLDEDVVIEKIASFFPTEKREFISQRLKNISPRYTGQHRIFENIFRRFSCEGRHVSSNELCFLINTVLAHSIEKRQERYSFSWIISAYNQINWTAELVLLQLENCFKQQVQEKALWRDYMSNIDNKEVLLVFAAQLARNSCSVKSVGSILYLLSNVRIESVILDELELTEWPYVLKEYYWAHLLKTLITWDHDQKSLSSASMFISSIENTYGETLIKKLFENLKSKSVYLTQVELNTILSYYHTQKWILCEDDLKELKHKTIEDWIKHMEKTQKVNLENLQISELVYAIKNNKNNSENVIAHLSRVENWVERISTNQILFKSMPVSTISDSDIQKWTEQFKKTEQKPTDVYEEMLAVIDRAIELKRGFRLRDTQRLTVLALLANDNKTLAQVSTGEGKSLIVVATALIKGLLGEKVDIVTSSSVLAKRDATVFTDIYTLFGLRASHNCSENIEDRKEAYSSNQIIYGDLANFQRDHLLDRFFGKRVLGDRNFQNVIVDEVDSMLLDKGNNMLYLSHDIAGMDKLEAVYVFIWQMVNIRTDLQEKELMKAIKWSVLYDMYPIVQKEDIHGLDNNLSKFNVLVLWERLVKCGIINDSGRLLIEDIDSKRLDEELSPEFTQYKDRLSFLLRSRLNRDINVKIPNYLKEFVERHLDQWISSALSVLYMVPGQYYVVDVDRSETSADRHANVIILDRDTGTDQVSSQWDEALHQFLQLKHGCKLSVQNLKAVFTSNVTFLKMYKLLYGLTGTLGSKRERHLLKKIHEVDFVTIPTAKTKRFEEYEPTICSGKEKWHQYIRHEAYKLTSDDNRSALIICETIEDVEALKKSFDTELCQNVRTYVRDYETFTIDEDGLQPGQIIIATNLAGRGTDIKISKELEHAGGLHVILTYLPANIRIEEQAFGRAARSGDKGSGRMIAKVGDEKTPHSCNIYTMKQKRNVDELLRLSSIETYYETTIKTEEDCFKRFNELYGKKIKQLEHAGTPDPVKEILLQSCLDKWSFWLDQHSALIGRSSDEVTKRQVILLLDQLIVQFEELEATNANNWPAWVEGNPMQMIKLGKHLSQDEHYNIGLQLLKQVIKIEPYFCEAACYYHVHTRCEIGDREMKKYLQMAKKLFEERIQNTMLECEIGRKLKNNSPQLKGYREQKKILINLYSLFTQSIDDLLGHVITPESFVYDKLKNDVAGKIFDELMNIGVIKKAEIIGNFTDAEIQKLHSDYFIPQDKLKKFLANHKGTINENDILEAIRKTFSFPNRIEFWKLCIAKNVLHSQVEYVEIDEERLTTIDPALMNVIKEKEEEGELIKEVIKIERNQILLIPEHHSIAYYEKSKLLQEIGENKYKSIEVQGLLSFNGKATIERSRISNCAFSSFDYITAEDISNKTQITANEVNNILHELVEQKVLERRGYGFVLTNNFHRKTLLPSYPLYENDIGYVLASCFAYRLALIDISRQLDVEECTDICIKLKVDPHRTFFNDLIEQEIIRAPVVTNEINEAKINGLNSKSMSKHTIKNKLCKEIGLSLEYSEVLFGVMLKNFWILPSSWMELYNFCIDEMTKSLLEVIAENGWSLPDNSKDLLLFLVENLHNDQLFVDSNSMDARKIFGKLKSACESVSENDEKTFYCFASKEYRHSVEDLKSCISSIDENHGLPATYDVGAAVEKCVSNHLLLTQEETVKHIVDVLKKSKSSLAAFKSTNGDLRSITDFCGKGNFGNIDEMRIFITNGLEHLLERKKITWRMLINPLLVAAFGIVQIAVGAVLKVCSIGLLKNLADPLIQQGVNDVMFAFRALNSGNFSWQNYKNQKLQSLMCTVANVKNYLLRGAKKVWNGFKVSGPTLECGKPVDKFTAFMRIIRRATEAKVKEGISFAETITGIDRIVVNKLKPMLNCLLTDILSGVKGQVENYEVTQMLRNVYKLRGEDKAKEIVEKLTQSCLGKKKISEALLPFAQELAKHLKQDIDNILKNYSRKENFIELTQQLSQVMNFEDRLAQVTKICKTTRQLLDSIDSEIELASIDDGATSFIETQFSEGKFERFWKTINKQWQTTLSSHVQNLVEQQVAIPVLIMAANTVNEKVNQVLEDISCNMDETESTNDEQRPRKKQKKKIIQPTMLTATQRYLTKQYHGQLLNIVHKARSPAQFIAIIRENAPMDLQCVEVCARVLHKALQAHPGMKSGLKITVHDEKGTIHSFPSVEKGLEIHLNLVDNHFTVYETEKSTMDTFDNNCLYGALARALPDLESRGEDGLKSILNKSFEHDTGMYELIHQALHRVSPHDELYANVRKNDPSQLISYDTNTQEYDFLSRVAPYMTHYAGQMKSIAEMTNHQVSDLIKVGCSMFKTQSGGFEHTHMVEIPILVEKLQIEFPDLYQRLAYHAGNTRCIERFLNVFYRIGGALDKEQIDWILKLATVDYTKEPNSHSKEVLENYKKYLLKVFDSTINSNSFTGEQVSDLKNVRKIINNTTTDVLFQQATKGYDFKYKHKPPGLGKRRPIVFKKCSQIDYFSLF